MDATGPQRDAFPLEDGGDGVSVETEPPGELLDPATRSIGGDESGDLRGVETGLGLLRWTLTAFSPHCSR